MDPLKKLWLNAFARQRFHTFNDRLLRRGMRGVGIDDFGPRQDRGEKLLLEKLSRQLPRGAVVFDVGAFIGNYSRFLAEQRSDLIIHAFEPNPVSYTKLAPSAAGRYTLHPFALGDKEGELTLHDPNAEGGSGCSTLVGSVIGGLYADQTTQNFSVPVKKLDDVMKNLGFARVEYLKIDAEGYDLMVLQGAQESIASGKIGVVQFEFNVMNIFSRTFMRDFYQILPQHQLFRIVQDGLVPLGAYNPVTCELFGIQNIVAVPEGMTIVD